MPVNRSDLIHIAIQRGFDRIAMSKLPKHKILDQLGGGLTLEEEAAQTERDERRKPLMGLKHADLKNKAILRGLPCSGDKAELIDMLIRDGNTALRTELDPDQEAIVVKWNQPKLVISAGPGAGKTTVLCALVSKIIKEQPDARIIMLAFNKEARRTLSTRVVSTTGDRKLLASKNASRAVIPPGRIGIRTFNEFARGIFHQNPEAIYDNHGSYDAELTKATAILSADEHPDFEWDWVIVDEGQDVQIKHSSLIDAIASRSSHIIVAGDPRQELYPGAIWFSQLCAVGCEILRYNHRSHPAIVAFTNEFSRRAFPRIHIEQIASRENADIPALQIMRHEPAAATKNEATTLMADAIANFLCEQAAPKDAYAIAPVTVRKYHAEELVSTIRQSIYDKKQWPVKVCAEENNDSSMVDICCIGTSRFLKGTERKAVALFMTDPPYEKYGISDVETKKLFYVAMSRAVDYLMINVGKNVAIPNSAYFTLLESCAVFATADIAPPKEIRMHHSNVLSISVTDLAKKIRADDVGLSTITSTTFPPIRLPHRSSTIVDADFRGHYVEAAIAKMVGADLLAPFKNDVVVTGATENAPYATDGCVIRGGKAMRLIPRNLLPLVDEIEIAADINSTADVAFLSAKADYSFKINKIWTISDEIEGALHENNPELIKAVSLLEKSAHSSAQSHGTWSYQRPTVMQLSYARPTAECRQPSAGYIVGTIDLVHANSHEYHIIEVKHATELPCHEVQLAIYGAMCLNTTAESSAAAAAESPVATKRVTTTLVNTARGHIKCVAPVDPNYVNGAARAILAIKQANACEGQRIKCKNFERVPTIIVVDIENDENVVIEVGAVAISGGDFDYISHFHGIAPECEAATRPCDSVETSDGPGFSLSSLIGIDITEEVHAAAVRYSPQLVSNFNKWVASFGHPDSVILVQWSGSDAARLRWYGKSFDLRNLFKTLLGVRGYKKAEVSSLKDAAATILGPKFAFQPHRALEDAIATTAILVAITDRNGIV